MNSLKKIPWGIFAGVSGVLVFFTIAGTVGANIIMNSITSIVEGAAGLFGTWWQSLLFACDIILGVIFIGSLVMYILNKLNVFGKKEDEEDD